MGKKIDNRAELLCANVDPSLRDLAITLANALFAMQKKIDSQIAVYNQLPLAQTVRVGTGEKMLRSNPALEEFRNTVKDYANTLNKLQDILGESASHDAINCLDTMRAKIRVVK